MNKKIIITGATGSIGGATARVLAGQGHELILMGRSEKKLQALKTTLSADTGNKNIDVVVADLGEPQSLRNAVELVRSKHQHIDALLNIAAVFRAKRGVNSRNEELTFATNHLGPFIVTNELLPLLKNAESGRVVTVTAPSTTKVNFDDLHSEKKYSAGFLGIFGASKMMNLLFTYSLAKKLQGSKVSAMAFHPGLVKSDLTTGMGAFMHWFFSKISSSPDKAASTLAEMATNAKYAGANGKFIKFDGKELKSSSYSYDPAIQDKLWNVSESMTGKLAKSA